MQKQRLKNQRNQRRNRRAQKQVKNQIQNLKRNDFYTICGRNSVLDALRAGRVERVYVSENVRSNEKIEEIVKVAKENKVRWETVNKSDIERLVKGFDNHQGVAALCKKAERLEFADFLHKVENNDNVCLVMLTEIEYEQNLGAILRTLDASGVDGVIVSSRIKNADSIVVKRVSMGASETVNMFTQNIFIALRMLKENGFKIIGIESIGKETYVNKDFSGRIALVFGGEDKSLTEPVLKECDEVISIPMQGTVTSLNVSVSVAVVVYERLRQILTIN